MSAEAGRDGGMRAEIKLPYVAWRDGRPRFVPGARERALGFKGKDLRHPDGRWFSLAEASDFATAKRNEIVEARSRLPLAPIAAPEKVPAGEVGYVYFLRCTDWLKVGFSNAPYRRMREIATRTPYKITTMAAVFGSRHDEARLHSALARHRINGEWFACSPEVVAAMMRCIAFGRVMPDLKDEERTKSHAA